MAIDLKLDCAIAGMPARVVIAGIVMSGLAQNVLYAEDGKLATNPHMLADAAFTLTDALLLRYNDLTNN
jgi:hypothetical protein